MKEITIQLCNTVSTVQNPYAMITVVIKLNKPRALSNLCVNTLS